MTTRSRSTERGEPRGLRSRGGAVVVACALVMPSVAWARADAGSMPMGSPQPEPEAGGESPAGGEAEGGPVRVLVLPARVSGGLPPDTAGEIRTIVATELAADGIEVLPEDASPVDCDEACRGAAARAVGADYLAQGQVVGDEDEFTVTVTLYGADGRELAPFVDACSICGLVEVRDMARLVTLDARTELRRRRRVAATPEPVVTTTIEPVAPPPVIPRSPLVPAGWAVGGAGSAATIGGVVLLALHQRSAGCLDNPRGGECVPVRYTTAIPGAVVLGVGVAAVVGGVVMVVLGRRAERRKADAAVAVRPHGLGLRVRF
jgi:hypothetical protein